MSVFEFTVRVYYEDTDAQGVVYYANYLKFMERARSEWLRQSDCPVSVLATDHNMVFVVRHLEIDYLAPAILDDDLTITVELTKTTKVSLMLDQKISKDQTILTRARLKMACLDAQRFKPVRIPQKINQLIEKR